MIYNPIITGFNPDPSFIRVGDDYYIATSTFEWFPGVQIHHSRDLVHWRLLTHVLTDVSLLDLKGIPSSGGIWAPHLSYHDGVFYLVYTIMRSRRSVYKDLRNYVVTSTSIRGPWSSPVYLNGSGFDPFLFHDDDGRKWLFNMRWDFRANKKRFSGILMQEYDVAKQTMTGPVKVVYEGTDLGVTEGPQLFKRGGYYYMLVAEGGTGINHAATLARSRQLDGPYETDPEYPLLTTRGNPEYPLQNAGHGALVETQAGDWYMAHICIRPFKGTHLNPMGRETSLQKCVWTDDGWLRLAHGGRLPALQLEAPPLELHPFDPEPARTDFSAGRLPVHFQSLRVPIDSSWLSLSERPGYLRLKGRDSLASWQEQSMIARRLQHYTCTVETCMEYDPEYFTQMAGLVFYYDESDYYYLRVTYDEAIGKKLGVTLSDIGQYKECSDQETVINNWSKIFLKAQVHDRELQFYASPDGVDWNAIGPILDMGSLSDEYGGKLGFTGTFIGLCAQDMNGTLKHVDYEYFLYEGTK